MCFGGGGEVRKLRSQSYTIHKSKLQTAIKKKTTKLKAKQNYNQKILEENTEELQRSLKEDSKTKTKENNDKYDHYQNFIFLKKKIQLTTPM